MFYFFDTYALVELLKANPNYEKYKKANIITFQLNLIELYYSLLSGNSDKVSKNIYNKFKSCIRDIDDETIFEAMQFKRKYKKKKLSYVDCLGYCFARRNKIKFLTGDKEFKNLKNVEFVK